MSSLPKVPELRAKWRVAFSTFDRMIYFVENRGVICTRYLQRAKPLVYELSVMMQNLPFLKHEFYTAGCPVGTVLAYLRRVERRIGPCAWSCAAVAYHPLGPGELPCPVLYDSRAPVDPGLRIP